MDFALPRPPPPIGRYRAVILRGGVGYVSGQLPLVDGVLSRRGLLGRDLDVAAGQVAARTAAVNVLAQIERALGGWDGFAGLCRLEGLIAATADFEDHARVLDAASDLLVETLGPELGGHARSVAGVACLPGGAPVELVATFAVRPLRAMA